MTNESPKIALYQPPPTLGVPNPSPFCLKVETWLKMAEIPYRVEICNNPSKGPKGQVPFANIHGELVGDSEIIIDRLVARFGAGPDVGLTRDQEAQSRLVTAALDDRFQWTIVYSRILDRRFTRQVRDAFMAGYPAPAKAMLWSLVRRSIRKRIWGQGLGRHSEEEIYDFAKKIIDALAGLLDEKSFFLGDRPRRIDAACYAFLASAYHCTLDTPQKAMVANHQNLTRYADRMRDRYFA